MKGSHTRLLAKCSTRKRSPNTTVEELLEQVEEVRIEFRRFILILYYYLILFCQNNIILFGIKFKICNFEFLTVKYLSIFVMMIMMCDNIIIKNVC